MIKKTERYKIAYKILSEISTKAYEDIYLLSNQVLSKNPLTNSFLNNYVSHGEVHKHNVGSLISKILTYYVKSVLHFIIYTANMLIFPIKGPKYVFPQNRDSLTVINIFFLIEKIIKSKQFADTYLPGLENVLKKVNRQFVYVPVFDRYGMSASHGNVLNVLKRQEVPILCEYQLLRITDLFHLLYFIVVYPFHVMRCFGDLSSGTYEIELVKHELLNTIDQVTFYNFSRYLQGRRISRLPFKDIKVISWFENQAGDKNFYKGLRENNSSVTIYGTQLMPFGEIDLNVIVDEDEKKFGIIPDKIIVNGPFYVPEGSTLNFRVGPSFRYKKIFEKKFNRDLQNNLLVLLPYAREYEENILKLLYDTKIDEENVIIKTHPASASLRFRQFLKPGYKIVDKNIYTLFENTKIVIGTATGSLLEAASMGIPVIVIKSPHILDYHMLPEYGKGIIWEEVLDAEALQRAIRMMDQRLNNEIEIIDRVSREYRDMFFSEPSENNIIKAFDLN